MEKRSLIDKHDAIKILLGTWANGNCLTHLKLIEPNDATDKDIADVIVQIKKTFASGINRAEHMTPDDRNKLLTALDKAGFDRSEVIDLIDEAVSRHTEYIAALAKLLEQKRIRLLSEIDWSKKGADKQAQKILSTYTVAGADELKPPAVNPASKLIEECKQLSETDKISAGTPILTSITGGLKPKQLIAIAAGTSVGKTAFAWQIAMNAAYAGKKVLHFPLEMSAEKMSGRGIARLTDGEVTMRDMENYHRLSEEKQEMILSAAKEMDRLTSTNLFLFESERELGKIQRQVEMYRPDIIVIDQLSLMEDSQHQSDTIRLQYKHFVEELKFTAMDYNCVVVLLAQLNRDGLRKGAIPTMHNIQESAAIEQTADDVFILYPEDEEQREDPTWRYLDMVLSIEKCRDGQAGYSLKMEYDLQAQIFYDAPTPKDEELLKKAGYAVYKDINGDD